MSLTEPLDRLPDAAPAMFVDSGASIGPVANSLKRIFEEQPVTVLEDESRDEPVEVVRDNRTIASSTIDELLETILLVNSDVYITGSRSLNEVTLPDVLKGLGDTRLVLRGYPESDSEKLLLITISRAIERLAYETGAGTLKAGFQRFSRLVEEPGTYRAYERLCGTDLDVHAYGVEDSPVPADLDLTVHEGTSELYRRCWFVVYRPPTTAGGSGVTNTERSSVDGRGQEQPDAPRMAGLYAVQHDRNTWEGFWSFEPEHVERIDRTIEQFADRRDRTSDANRPGDCQAE